MDLLEFVVKFQESSDKFTKNLELFVNVKSSRKIQEKPGNF